MTNPNININTHPVARAILKHNNDENQTELTPSLVQQYLNAHNSNGIQVIDIRDYNQFCSLIRGQQSGSSDKNCPIKANQFLKFSENISKDSRWGLPGVSHATQKQAESLDAAISKVVESFKKAEEKGRNSNSDITEGFINLLPHFFTLLLKDANYKKFVTVAALNKLAKKIDAMVKEQSKEDWARIDTGTLLDAATGDNYSNPPNWAVRPDDSVLRIFRSDGRAYENLILALFYLSKK